MADIREKFSLPVDEEFILSDYPTLNHMIAYIQRMTGGDVAVAAPAAPTSPVPVAPVPQPAPAPAPVAASPPTLAPLAPTVDDASLNATVVEVVVKHTGYPADFIELDQDLEGELGIDTVKQAEIMADIRERFSLPLDEDFILSDYPTLNHMIGYIQRMQGGGAPAPVPHPRLLQSQCQHQIHKQRPQEHVLHQRQWPRTVMLIPNWWKSSLNTLVIPQTSSKWIKTLKGNWALIQSSKRKSWVTYAMPFRSLWMRTLFSPTTRH
jgi:acyl carrier protein